MGKNRAVNDRIRGGLGFVTNTDEGKAARKGPEGVQPEDKDVKDLTQLTEPELAAELSDASSKAKDALEAVTALSEELGARLGEEEGREEATRG